MSDIDTSTLLLAVAELSEKEDLSEEEKEEALEKLVEELEGQTRETSQGENEESNSKDKEKKDPPKKSLLSSVVVKRRLIKKQEEARILAIDMDGTLVDTPKHGSGPPPSLDGIGPRLIDLPDGGRVSVVEAVQIAARQGKRIIIFTGRDDYEEVSRWLTKYEVPYESINHRVDQPTSSPKVIASAYIDNRSVTPEKFVEFIMSDRSNKEKSLRFNKDRVYSTSIRKASKEQVLNKIRQMSGRFNHIYLSDLGRELGMTPQDLTPIIQQLRRDWLITGSQIEGRNRATPEQQRFITPDGIGIVGLRE